MDDHRREGLLKEYGEVSSNFRLLTDIRFKLLAFLPIVSAAAAAFKGDSIDFASFALSLFGLVATIGLVTYNARNDQLYDELVGRAASIERSLGLPDGAFANRPQAWSTVHIPGLRWKFIHIPGLRWNVNHRTGVAIIYAASIALWMFGVLAPLVELGRRVYVASGLPHFLVTDPTAWTQVIALALALRITYSAGKKIKSQRERREKEMRDIAASAVKRALAIDLARAADDVELIPLCATLSGEKPEKIRARAAFLSSIDLESLKHYLSRASREQTASHLVALLTDLPPGWLFDCTTNRRGNAAAQDLSGPGHDLQKGR